MAHAARLADEGADLVDVGGESTRPGAAPVPVDEEIERVVPVIEGLRAARPGVAISVDTRRSEVAQAALGAGAHAVNDVSAGADPAMFPIVREARRRDGADAHAGRPTDDAGRPSLRRRRGRGARGPARAGRGGAVRGARRRAGSRSTRASGSARTSTTTSSCCGASTRSPTWTRRSCWASAGSASSARSPGSRIRPTGWRGRWRRRSGARPTAPTSCASTTSRPPSGRSP